MPFQPAPNVVEIVLNFQGENQDMVNVFHAHYAVRPTFADLQTLGDEIIDWQATYLAPRRSNQVYFNSVRLTDLTDQNTAPVIRQPANAVPGGFAGDWLPFNSTWCVKWLSAGRGRGKQGRTFHVGLAEGQVNGNYVRNDEAAAILNAYNQLRLMVTDGADRQLVILHRTSGGSTLPEATFTPVVGVGASDNTIDSQRTRLPNHKRRRSSQP